MAMRFHLVPPSLIHLVTTILLTPRPIAANPHPLASVQAGFTFNQLFARYECSGELCGYDDQLCCQSGSACYTDSSNDQASCSSTAGGTYSTSAAAGSGGYWEYITSTITDQEVYTTTMSEYVGVTAAATATGKCQYALNETPCGSICCAGNQYCAYAGQCSAADNGDSSSDETVAATAAGGVTATETESSSSGATVVAPGAPIRGTSSANTVVTQTQSPTTTVPFMPPVATGANITMTQDEHHSGGLSGGAIAGIVIGVLVGLFLLGLICFYCCLKGLLDGVLALFGLGKRRKRTEVEEYERRTHHSSGGGGPVRRTWWGASRPSRVERREERRSSTGRDLLGWGAGLGALWAILGLKRRNRRRNEEKYSEYSETDYTYTSASE